MNLSTDSQARKEQPVASGVLNYFPNAIAEIAHVSYVGNQKHNPGMNLHWSRGKSNDHADCVARHLLEAGQIDDDGLRHTAKLAWRALAMLQIELEKEDAEEMLASPEGGEVEEPADAVYVACGGPAPTFDSKYEGTWHSVGWEGDDRVVIKNGLATWYVAGGKPYIDSPSDTEYMAIDSGRWVRVQEKPHGSRGAFLSLLIDLGCPPTVAQHIMGGMTLTTKVAQKTAPWVYVAGPMRGIKDFNFPAFDETRDRLLEQGYNVISPADIDRAAGLTLTTLELILDQTTFAFRDFWSLYFISQKGRGALATLPNWPRSVGASAEFFLARWLGLKMLDHQGDPHPDAFHEFIAAHA